MAKNKKKKISIWTILSIIGGFVVFTWLLLIYLTFIDWLRNTEGAFLITTTLLIIVMITGIVNYRTILKMLKKQFVKN